ncbi:MAG TPA: EAL domain-containing protein [Pseudorhodoplanes sp.]|nr:EAL domain-containing protein [Pseudorhodoplanes sp.]
MRVRRVNAVLKAVSPSLWRRWRLLGAWTKSLFSSIGMRLVMVVLVTGVLAFATIGSLTMFRLQAGLKEQATALGELSERQMVHRLDSEAQLARARVEAIGQEMPLGLRQIAQRSDVSRAVVSQNDVALRELLFAVARTSGFDVLIAFDESGRVMGANTGNNLLAINNYIRGTDFGAKLSRILENNTRAHPRALASTGELDAEFSRILNLSEPAVVAHFAFEPVFDDFGDLIGALGAIRTLGEREHTLENFTSLSNAGVMILRGTDVVSAAGPEGVRLSNLNQSSDELIRSDDGAHVARCVDYEQTLKVCTFTDASAVTATKNQMFRIGAEQTQTLMRQFLASAALTLAALIVALLIIVRHTTKGLSDLSAAARAVAGGDLDTPFSVKGVGEVRGLSLAFERMLSNLRSSMGQIRKLAFYDTITELPNREKIKIDAPDAIEDAKFGTLLFIDLDGFKSINDTFGHNMGDQLLRKVSKALREYFLEAKDIYRTGSIQLARVGGDEFVVIIPGIESKQQAGAIASGAIDVLRQPFNINGSKINIGASVGITMFPTDAVSYEDLLVNADLAMYAAKNKGRGTYMFYTPELASSARERLTLENELKEAIKNRALSVHYQPKCDCHDGRIRGVEALVRWRHPRLGPIPAGQFIKMAEETGMIADIDRFVISQAVREIGGLIREGSDIVLAVNVTGSEIGDPFFIRDIVRVLKDENYPPPQLEIEITESIAMRDPEQVASRVAGLRQLGIRLAIDDFGAGYSNLATLARLPFDTIKLDRSLITNVANDPEKQSILRIALGLAKELGFESVAEGVETLEDLKFVANAGATMGQGYVFSPAVPLEELKVLLEPRRLAGKRVEAAAPEKRKMHS